MDVAECNTELDGLVEQINSLRGEKRRQVMELIHDGLLRQFGDEGAKKLWDNVLAVLAQQDSPEGYEAFYECLYGFSPPKHIMRIIRKVYKAHGEGLGCLAFSWVGSWKTISLVVTFIAFRVGKEPHKTSLVAAANDDSAEKITRAIAALIESNPNWKKVYPSVVPDAQRGWSVEGFWVKDISVPEDEWARKSGGVVDPTFVGGGYTSTRLNGKHPTGVLAIDDIHDINNSISQRERKSVVEALRTVILKRAVRNEDKLVTWLVVDGFPWDPDDGYHMMKNSGQYEFINVPAMVKAKEDDEGAVYCDGVNRDGRVFEDLIGWWKLTWPEHYNMGSIIADRALGKSAFWQTIMLDLIQAKATGLKYYTYDHNDVQREWPSAGGCDFAETLTGSPDPGRDFFALLYGSRTPRNQLVVVGGVFTQCTQAQAEKHLHQPESLFPNWQGTVIEGDGVGEPFYVSLTNRNPNLNIRMDKTRGKNKRWRQEREMGPWLEVGTVLISDRDEPALNALRQALDDFPEGNNDIRDALYWLCKQFPEVLVTTMIEDSLPPTEEMRKTGLGSVWNSLGARRG